MKLCKTRFSRAISLVLTLICLLGLLPTSALAAGPDTVTMEDCTFNGVQYDSPALGNCYLHYMQFDYNGQSITGFCAEHGKAMSRTLEGHTWSAPTPVNNPTVEILLAYYYSHTMGVFTDQAHVLGEDELWDEDYTWTMNAWVQAVVWRCLEDMASDPITASAEELLSVCNELEHANCTDIDDEMGNGMSFRERAQYILDLGRQGVWGDCAVYEYEYTGPGTSRYPAHTIQDILIGELTVTREQYSLTIRKVDATNSNQGLSGARFLVQSVNGSYSKEVVTGSDGTVTLSPMEANTYSIVEQSAPEGYRIDSTVPQYVTLPNGNGATATVTFADTPIVTGAGSIRKVDADDPTRGLAGAVIKIEGVDNSFTGTYTTGAGGYLENVPWNAMPVGTFTATEITPPNGYSLSDDPDKVKQEFYWDGQHDVNLVFENDARVKIELRKVDESGEPIAGAVFNVVKDGQVIATEATDADGSIIIPNVTEGLFAFVETHVPSPFALLEEPVIIHVDQADVDGGGTMTVTAVDPTLPKLTILKTDADDPTVVIPGTVFLVEGIDSDHTDEWTTGADGAVSKHVAPGSYRISEKSVPAPYYISTAEAEQVRTVSLNVGEEKTISFANHRRPAIEIVKENSVTHDPIENVKMQVWYSPGSTDEYSDLGTYFTDEAGRIVLSEPDISLRDGWYRVRELEPAPGFSLPDEDTQEAYISAGDSHTFRFEDHPLSAICVWKYDSETGAAIEGAVFQVRYLSGSTSGTGGTVIGTYHTSPNGSFTVTGCEAGAYIIEELSSDSAHVIDTPPQTVYLSGEEQEVVQVYFGNSPKGSLLVTKISDDEKKEPLSGVEFLVTTSDGTLVGNANGKFRTDSTGSFLVEGIDPGTTLVVRETRAKDGYLLDDTPQTAVIRVGQTVKLEFRNQPLGELIVHKLSSTDKKPLEGVQFKITCADGSYLSDENGKLSSNGMYRTNSEGQIVLSNVTGPLVVTEVQSIPGYTIDPDTRSQTVEVQPGETQQLWFYNDPVGGVEIIKVNEVDRTERIPNTTFEIRKVDDELIDTVTTGEDGRVFAALEDGAYYAVEIEAAEGFQVDPTPHYFEVEGGKTVSLTVTNRAFSGILIHKIDANTREGIYGVTFLLYDASKNPIGQYTSDDRGYVYIDDLPSSGRYYLRELENEGYIVDEQLKTVYVTSGTTTEIVWENTAITGQIQVIKTSADYNSMNGWPAGTPIPNTEFEIYNARTGRLVDTIKTDKNGVAVSKPLPLARYKIVESKAADFYGLNQTPIEVEIEYAGQIVKAAMTNKSLYTNVSIKKTGYVEVMPGQQIRYDFSGIGNNSTTSLTSYYWRDTLPTQAVRLDKIVTGTYNVPGNYKVVYKTNLDPNYQTMYDNLSTQQNYVLDASPAALGLASNEVITEFMVVFGVVPANFRQVEAPQIYCNVVSWLTGGMEFVNQADTGGIYDGQWIMAASRWVTRVYTPAEPLPRTGY